MGYLPGYKDMTFEGQVRIEMFKLVWFLENYIHNKEWQWYKRDRSICECHIEQNRNA